MYNTFKLGFEVEVERNLTLYKTFSILTDLSKNPDLKQASNFVHILSESNFQFFDSWEVLMKHIIGNKNRHKNLI